MTAPGSKQSTLEPGAPQGRPRSGPAAGQLDRRAVIAAAVILAVAIVGGVTIVALKAREPSAAEIKRNNAEANDGPPSIIVAPNTGAKPQDGGDRGGWEQLTIFGLILASMVGLGFVVFLGSRRQRAGRAAWRAAAATGRDGAVPRDPRFDPPVSLP